MDFIYFLATKEVTRPSGTAMPPRLVVLFFRKQFPLLLT